MVVSVTVSRLNQRTLLSRFGFGLIVYSEAIHLDVSTVKSTRIENALSPPGELLRPAMARRIASRCAVTRLTGRTLQAFEGGHHTRRGIGVSAESQLVVSGRQLFHQRRRGRNGQNAHELRRCEPRRLFESLPL